MKHEKKESFMLDLRQPLTVAAAVLTLGNQLNVWQHFIRHSEFGLFFDLEF